MAFVVNTLHEAAGGRPGDVLELTDAAGAARAEVWPAWGFNCLRWQVRQPGGDWGDLLYHAPDWETNPVPTRSGQPVLFPFPGRMRDGRFTFDGRTYQLPLSDSSKKHAIHGFTPRLPWRVVGQQSGAESAAVAGRFEVPADDPAGAWPGPCALQLRYELSADRLRVEATVQNLGGGPVPFGLGYHPYFRLPGVADPDVSRYVLQANVGRVWEVDADNLPTGTTREAPGEIDFRQPRPIGGTALDHVLTGVTVTAGEGGLVELAVLSHPDSPGRLRIRADPAFRDLVLFTPPHRQAIAVEPYTCSADAANLAARGVDSGWRTLPPGGAWSAAVEYRWET
jgi:aldose 1-epimerase